ncbi:OmpA family protein [bacterium]|nr:OmpA family protein [bacterium]
MKKADTAYNNEEYAVAADMYDLIMDKTDDRKVKQKAAFQAGECHRERHDPKQAAKYYERAIKYGVNDPIVIYRLAEMKKELGEYEAAIELFKQYQKENPSDPRAETQIKGCEAALKWKDEKSRYIVEEFKPANENESDDFSPMWADRREKSIMFTSDRQGGESKETFGRTGRYHQDVWVVEEEGKRGKVKWSDAKVVEGLNTDVNDGVICFNRRYSTMYVTQCNGEKGKERNCKIYEARKRGTGWEVDEQPLDFCFDEGKNKWTYGHPTLGDDDKTMYFASNRPGGYGDTNSYDIWMVTYVRRGRTWSEPINLGPVINTEGNEMFPYMHGDGTLYFSSDGHAGMGGLDLFYTNKNGEGPEDWEYPSNMKSPMNSSFDDFGIILDATKENGYFSSNRKKEKDDIYEFHMEPIECTLKGQITDCDSGTAIKEALVAISNNHDTSVIRILTDEKGYYETPISINTEYTIEVSKRQDYYYDAKPQYVSTVGVENSLDCQHIKDFCLKNTCNDVFVLPIYYDLDKAFIRADAKPILDDLIETLTKYPKMKVELGSHTDCRSSYEYNRALSQRRADSAIAYIIDKGNVNPFRLEARGYGESQLVNHCECEGATKVPCTEEEHQANRRTTVKVVNCNFDVGSIGIDYKLRNDSALLGKGSIYSPYLLAKQKDYLVKSKGNIDSFLRAKAIEDSIAKADAAYAELIAKYDFIDLNKRRDSYQVDANIGSKRMRMDFNNEERRTLIPQDVVEQLMNAGTISTADFANGKDKIKLENGEKVYSTSFTIPELTIGKYTFKNVKCKMVEPRSDAVLGYNVFKDYVEVEIKDGKIWLLKPE